MENEKKTAFCEDSRVKFPTLMHLMGMGFKYVSLKGLKNKYVEAPKTEFDPLTNILTDYFHRLTMGLILMHKKGMQRKC